MNRNIIIIISKIETASISGDSRTRLRFTTAPGTRNHDCPLLLDHQPSLKVHLPFIVSFLNWPSVMPLASVLKIFPPWSDGVTFRWSTPPSLLPPDPYYQSTAPPLPSDSQLSNLSVTKRGILTWNQAGVSETNYTCNQTDPHVA